MRLAPSRFLLFSLVVPTLANSRSPIETLGALEAQSLFWRSPQRTRNPSHRGRRPSAQLDAVSSGWNGTSTLFLAGTSGVGAMQMSVVDDDHVLFYDKAEGNPLQVNGHSAWGSIYTISTHKLRPLNLKTNSFCAGGGWISDGTLVSVGGQNRESLLASYVGSGFQSIRLFTPCGEGDCDVFEDPQNLHLTSNRWYPSSTRLEDGSLMILGGSNIGGFNDAWYKENPTFEFYPPKGNGRQIWSRFLADSVPTNLFPITFTLPSGEIFVAANRIAMIYNWKSNTERRLPGLPNGVRVNYPASAASVLLPLTIANKWTPEVLICGGSSQANTDGWAFQISALTPASTQCVRMVLDEAGIAGGWIVEQMNSPRVMGDAILTPDGKVLIVNGAKSGVAGYDNVSATGKIGHSNAANPNYTPTLYSPLAPTGSRFSDNFPTSSIERLYHSSASLLPDGRIMISGSNPNPAVSTQTFATHYEVEILSPPYVNLARPLVASVPSNLHYGEAISVNVTAPSDTKIFSAVIMDLGYSTHGVHMNHRSVELVTSTTGAGLVVTGPATTGIYPPGYAWLYVLADGVPSKGLRIMIGNGAAPPTNA